MQLKTLKDIRFTTLPQYEMRKVLRKEAIEWIKSILRSVDTTIEKINDCGELLHLEFDWEFSEDHYNQTELAGLLIHFIMDRFNLTEDDLK